MSAQDYRFIKACWGKPVDKTPIWIMRQAGRYMKEYRDVREKAGSFLKLCKTPDLAAEVTLQPIDALGVDAAIMFSDILTVPEAMGMDLDFLDGEGPKLGPVIRTAEDVSKLHISRPEDLSYVTDTIKILRNDLQGRVPLIGFSGAPFTLASYMVEGGSSKNFIELKKMMFQNRETMHKLLGMVADSVRDYLNAQIEAGAQAVQIFDSWAGHLTPRDYREFALPYTKRIISELRRDGIGEGPIPVIHFVYNGSSLLEDVQTAGADVVGIDWHIDIANARARINDDLAIQGNMDPTVLFADPEEIRERAGEIIKGNGGKPGHIFNLGHGILPPTPVEHAQELVKAVHDLS